MANLSGKIFFYAQKGRIGKDNKEVVITESNNHTNPGIRISLSHEAVDKLGQGCERIIIAIHKDFRNRLYIYDAKEIPKYTGYKLCDAGARKCAKISNNDSGVDLVEAIGTYSLERDKYNDTYIALNHAI